MRLEGFVHRERKLNWCHTVAIVIYHPSNFSLLKASLIRLEALILLHRLYRSFANKSCSLDIIFSSGQTEELRILLLSCLLWHRVNLPNRNLYVCLLSKPINRLGVWSRKRVYYLLHRLLLLQQKLRNSLWLRHDWRWFLWLLWQRLFTFFKDLFCCKELKTGHLNRSRSRDTIQHRLCCLLFFLGGEVNGFDWY